MIAAVRKLRPQKLSSAYLSLVRRFPLRPIRTELEYDRAGELLAELFNRPDVNDDVRGYADTLVLLVEAYDRRHYAPGRDQRSPLQRLKYLMEQSGLSISGLGRALGSQPAASMILSGKRELSKEHIRRLAAYFKVDAGFFL